MESFKTRLITSEKLPLVLEPTNPHMQRQEFLDLLRKHRPYMQEKLLDHGGILFRNCPIKGGVDDFGAAVEALGLGKYIDYIGGDSPRNKIKDGIYTSTEAPPSIKIPLHNELSFVKNHPKHIYFYCETPSKADGETILADARKVVKAVDDQVKKRFDQKGLKYVSCYFYKSKVMDALNNFRKAHKSWIDVFETTNKQEVEEKCLQNDFAFRWTQNDWIQISQTRPSTMVHPQTKETVWFNQAHLFDFSPKLLGWGRYLAAKAFYCRKHMRLHEIYYADGSPIPRSDLYHVMDVLDANTVKFPWKKGDLLVLDNVLAMHGRATFEGKRRVLTAMTG